MRWLIHNIYRKRSDWCHKGDFGKLLVVGGSSDYSGSPILNALAAYRAGCDLVRIAAPETAANAAKSYSPNLIAVPLRGETLYVNHVKQILEMQNDAKAMVIGGGLTRKKDVLYTVKEILKRTAIPTVIDADALYAVDSVLNKKCILLPHAREFEILSGHKPSADLKSRKEEVRLLAATFNCVVLLKGHIDIISDGIKVIENHTGCSYMTKGGMGDTLAGICGALLARGVDAFEAACAAAYINGKAGELAARKWKESLLATDMLNEIANAIR